MTRCVLLLCLGTFLTLNFAELQDTSEINKSAKDYPDGLDYVDDTDAQGSVVNTNSTETKVDRWPGRRADAQKRGKQRIWKVIRREVRDMKNFLPTLASNISWMDLDVKDMNRNFFSLVGDIRVIKSEIMMIKKLAHTIWQNVTDTRRDHKQMNKTLWWILNNVTIVIDDVEKTVKYLTDMSTSYGTVTEKLEGAVESMSSEFSQIKTTLKADFDQIKNDMKALSEIVFNMSHVLSEIRDNVSRLSAQSNDGILAEVAEIGAGIASQSQLINTISTSVAHMTTDILHASRRIEEIAMLVNTLRERIDIVGERMLTVNSNMSKIRDGMVSVDEKVSLIGLNIADIYRQLGDLGVNITAFEGSFSGLTNNINGMHHNFARVDSQLGQVHNRIATDVGAIMGNLDEMKIELRDIRGVLREKCELSCKPQDKYDGNHTRPPINDIAVGPDDTRDRPKPEYQPTPDPPARPSQPIPPYPAHPIPGQPDVPYYPVPLPPGYPPSTPDYARPSTEYPPASLHPPQPTPGYPSYPNVPGPGQPPSSQFPFQPTPGYPPTTPQPTLYPQTTLYPPYPIYPPARPSDHLYPYPTSHPAPYPTTIVYPNYYPSPYPPPTFYPPHYPSTTFYPITTGYPPIPDYGLPPSVPAGVPIPSQPSMPPSPGFFEETPTSWTGVGLPAGPHGPGLPIGCGKEFIGICACACPCACNCPRIESNRLPSINSAHERIPLSGRHDCQCICSCPCATTVPPIGTRPGSPPVFPAPTNPDGCLCDRKFFNDLVREMRVPAHKSDEIERIIKSEHTKTRDVMLGEVDTKLSEFGKDIRVILDANLNLVTDTHNITFTLQDMKKEMFDEIRRISWMVQAVGLEMTQAVMSLMFPPDNDPGDNATDEEQDDEPVRPPARPDGPASNFISLGRPPPSRFDPPMNYHRPPAHMPAYVRPGRPPARPSGRPGKPPTQHLMPSSVWDKLERPAWPSYSSGATVTGTNPMVARQNTYDASKDQARRGKNHTSSINGTTEVNQSSEVALRLLLDDISAKSSKHAKKSLEKENKRTDKDCITTDVQSEALLRSPKLNRAKKISYSENSIDSEVDDGLKKDEDAYNVATVPFGLAKESETEVSIQDHDKKLDLIDEPMDPLAFHNILRKHIDNQWMGFVAPGSGHHTKRKRRPFGRPHGRTRKRLKVMRESLFPQMSGFPFTPPSTGIVGAIPHGALQNPLRIRPPRMPIIRPITLIPNIFASIPHRINGLPYSASYNDGKGNSWNINVNRRSNSVGTSESKEDVKTTSDEGYKLYEEESQLTEGENQSNQHQMAEQKHPEERRETQAQGRNEDDIEEESLAEKAEHQAVGVSKEEETDEFAGHE